MDQWNKCIKYMTQRTRFSLSHECPDGIVTSETLQKIRDYMIDFKTGLVPPNIYQLQHNEQQGAIQYTHDGAEITGVCKKYTFKLFLADISQFMANATGDALNEIKEAVINEYVKIPENREYDPNVMHWHDMWSTLDIPSRFIVIKVVMKYFDMPSTLYTHTDYVLDTFDKAYVANVRA